MSRMLWTRAIISGFWRSCSMSCISWLVSWLGTAFFFVIPTVFRDVAKFVHFIRRKSLLSSHPLLITPLIGCGPSGSLRTATMAGSHSASPQPLRVGVVSITPALQLPRRLQPCGVSRITPGDRIRVDLNYESIHRFPPSHFSSGLRAGTADEHAGL